LYRRPLEGPLPRPTIPDMPHNPRIRRLALVPVEGPHDELRRYRLARMDELALATPPDPSAAPADTSPDEEIAVHLRRVAEE
jgi:hypothetical protein